MSLGKKLEVHMDMMDCRYVQLQSALDGYELSDTPLVAFSDSTYFPAGFTDDQGAYYFVPLIAKTFGLSIPQTVDLFFGSLLFLGVLISLSCFFFRFRSAISWLFSMGAILLLAKYCYFDFYTTSFVAATCTIPLFLKGNNRALLASIAFSGLVLGYCNFIRTHAGTGAFLFILSWILLNQELTTKDKSKAALALVLFTLIPYFYFFSLEKERDRFLEKNAPHYVSTTVSHPKWHAIYLGFSYLDNPYGIRWADTCAFDHAKSIKPDVILYSEEYEEILKNECFSLIKKDPLFILKTILAKLLVILFKIVKFANVGLLLLLYVRPPLRELIPFFLAISFYSIPGILTRPDNAYLSGLLTVSTLLGIYLIGKGVEKYQTSLKHSTLRIDSCK